LNIIIPQTRYLKIKVIPRSHINEVVDLMIGEDNEQIYKIRIKAPPEKGKANAELVKFLGKHLDIPKDRIEIIAGKSETTKLIRIK